MGWLPLYQYGEYCALILIAFIGFLLVLKYRKEVISSALLLFFSGSSIVTVVLSLYQSYYRDYEPQGRYIITVWLFIGYIFAVAFDNLKLNVGEHKENNENRITVIEPVSAIAILWLLMFVRIWFETLSRMFS